MTRLLVLCLVLCASSARDPAAGPPRFPVRAAADGRYLVDATGRPFFMVGDAAQSAAGALTLDEWRQYIHARASQGFNTVNVNFVEHQHAPNPPADRSGNMPFLKTLDGRPYRTASEIPDLATPNDRYWSGLEEKVAYAQSRGVLVSLAFYMGGGPQNCARHPEGWYGELCRNTIGSVTRFGTYLANGGGAFGGLKNYPNVIWVWGADLRFTTDTSTRDKLHTIAAALKAAGSTQLMSGDWGLGLATDQPGFATYMDLESLYEYEPPAGSGIAATARRGFAYVSSSTAADGRQRRSLPLFMKETGYEAEANPAGDVASLRKFAWESILNGAIGGYWYGHRDVWSFARPARGYTPCLFPGCADWTSSLSAAGALDMKRLASLLDTIPWQRLLPSGAAAPFVGRDLVPGNQRAGGPIAAAQTRDGTLLLAYLPANGKGSQTFIVDPRSMSGAAHVRWWDPTSAKFTEAGTIPNSSTQLVASPGPNASGTNDWLLVLQTDLPAPFGISPAAPTLAPNGS